MLLLQIAKYSGNSISSCYSSHSCCCCCCCCCCCSCCCCAASEAFRVDLLLFHTSRNSLFCCNNISGRIPSLDDLHSLHQVTTSSTNGILERNSIGNFFFSVRGRNNLVDLRRVARFRPLLGAGAGIFFSRENIFRWKSFELMVVLAA